MLKKLHESHMGIVKMKRRRRDIMYWPGISSDTENMVGQCPTCKMFQQSNPAEPLKSNPTSNSPWCKVTVDLFDVSGKTYIVGVTITLHTCCQSTE